MTYTTQQINSDFRIKVHGYNNEGDKINMLVGVSGFRLPVVNRRTTHAKVFGSRLHGRHRCNGMQTPSRTESHVLFKIKMELDMKTTLAKAIGKLVKFKENGYLFEVLNNRNSKGWIAVRRYNEESIWDYYAPWAKCKIQENQ